VVVLGAIAGGIVIALSTYPCGNLNTNEFATCRHYVAGVLIVVAGLVISALLLFMSRKRSHPN
jgi:hypothetical protein